jgi:hypothetical protein
MTFPTIITVEVEKLKTRRKYNEKEVKAGKH